MAPKRRSSETDEQIIKQGCLIKSPPAYIFNKRTSWKGRLLKLCRTGMGSFILRYYAYDGVSEELKGEIPLSDIKSIELGKNTMEKIPTITRLFNNHPSNILCIKTDRRDYYLVDDNKENIAEWQKCITDACVKVHLKVKIDGPTSLSANPPTVEEDQEEVVRPKSYPEDHPQTEAVLVEESNRQRSHTDPETWKGNPFVVDDFKDLELFFSKGEICPKRQDCNTLAICCQIPSTHQPQEVRRHSAAASLQANPEGCRLSDDMTDPAYDSETEPIYDIPRPQPVEIDSAVEQEGSSDLDSEEGDVYEKMSSIVIDKADTLPPKPPRTFKITPINSEQQSESDLESIKVTVPTKHLQEYLGLQEIGERLCVSKWKGPLHIGCLFHHADHIESINGFRPGSKDLFFQMLNNSISDEVHLGLIRNKKAAVFHLEGCSCDSL